MTKGDKALAKEVLKFLKDAGIKVQACEDYDNEDNYAGTRYYLARAGNVISAEALYDAQEV